MLRLGSSEGCRVVESDGCGELFKEALVGASDERDGLSVVGVGVVGLTVVGESVVGLTVVGEGVVGLTVVGEGVVGLTVVGEGVVGLTVVGESVVGPTVVGESVVGSRLVGATVEGALDVGPTVDGVAVLGAEVHAPTLHAADSDVVGQACATPVVGAEATARARKCDPPPQATEQSLQPLQSPTLQSLHVIAEQKMLPDNGRHGAPPACAISLTERQRLELPEEQEASQVAHRLQAVTAQSTGHVSITHALSPVVLAQAMPPAAEGTAMLRVL